MSKYVGVDIGGTFTDLVLYDTESGSVGVHKVRSTPDDPGRALVSGIGELCAKTGADPADLDAVLHGTTVATNAILEHRGAHTGMLTTRGFRDVIHIGRHQRPQHYSVMQDIPWQNRPFVRRRNRHVVSERLVPPTGDVLTVLNEDDVRTAAAALRAEGVEAVAVCFLFSYLNPQHEQRAAEILREELPGVFVTTSSDVSPQFREFERFTTTAMNAFVGPGTGTYISSLTQSLNAHGIRGQLSIMRSNGGVAGARAASERPVTLLMSGPAAGVMGGAWVGDLIGRDRLITFDVGGTSADIAVITEHGIVESSARDTEIDGFPVLVPMIDIHAIGAGGGSIARVDDGGAFRVGPRSAGAVPGPACYDNGGTEPTVTDAHLALGRLSTARALAGGLQLNRGAAVEAISSLAGQLDISTTEAAEGILRITNSHMAEAIRSRTIQKGHDPRTFSLVAFGGAGPLHAAEVAAALGIDEVLIPPHPGITSATGLLTSDLKYDGMRTVFQTELDLDFARIAESFTALEDELRTQLAADGLKATSIEVVRSLECRYAGQGYELKVPVNDGALDESVLATFHDIHEKEYGRRLPDPIEIVNLRVSVVGKRARLSKVQLPQVPDVETIEVVDGVYRVSGALQTFPTPVVERAALRPEASRMGPLVLLQQDTTIVVPPGWEARTHESGVLVLTNRNPEG